MSDVSLLWGGDLTANPVGDLALVDDTQLGQQRVLRRLLTNPGDYIWSPTYGAGLAQFVGETVDVARIRARIRSQIFLESVVARTPEPVIDVNPSSDGNIYIQLRYVDAPSHESQTLTFSVQGP